jgi:hypothetical protein
LGGDSVATLHLFFLKKKKKKHLGGGFYKEQATARPLEAFWIYFMQ